MASLLATTSAHADQIAAAFAWDDPPPPEPANQERVTIGLWSAAGSLQLSDGINQGLTELTTETGYGLRVAYGVSKNSTLVADIGYLASGTAKFADVTWNDVTGTLERRNRALRVMGGALLHTSGTIAPFVGAAVGPRIFDDDKRLTSGERSDSGLESGLLIALRVGVDAWLGDSFVIGVSGGYVGGFDGASQSIEARLHVGYAFKP